MNEQELMMKHQKRKDRIKNIAIIFLVIMLLLTFFSNTIMNYSLSEVGTAYASSGPLTTKIRGDGYVSAKDPEQVKTDKTSEVLEVLVKNGDQVKKGDTMFVLEGASASDLKQAQSDLLTMNYDYEKALLEISVPDYEKNNMEIKYAKKELEQALQNIKDVQKSITKKEKEYNKLKKEADKAKEKMDQAKDKADKAKEKADAQDIKVTDKAAEISQIELTLEEYENEKTALSAESNDDILAKQTAVTEAERAVEDAKEQESQYESERTSSIISAEIKEKKKTITSLQKELEDLKEKLTEAQNTTADDTETTSITRSIRNKKTEISDVNTEISSINTEIRSINTQISSTQSQISSKTADYNKEENEEEKEKIQEEIKKLEDTLDSLQSNLSEQKKNLSTQQKSLASLQQELSDLQQDLTKAQQKASSDVASQLKQAKKDVSDKEAEITTANQELSELQQEKTASDEREANLKSAQSVTASYEKVLKEAKRNLEDAQNALKKDNSQGIEEIEAKIKEAKAERKKLNSEKTELDNKKTKLDNKKTKLDNTYTELQTAYQDAKAKADAFQAADETTLDTANQTAEEKRKALETLYIDLASTQKDDTLKQQLSVLDSDQKKKLIDQKKKEIKKLKKKKKPVKIKAKSAGIVQSVSIKVGDTTSADTALAEIQLKKNGYELSIPVTVEQSKLVKRGDNASVLNIWDDSIKAVLSEIKTDAENPNSGRTLVFDITGDVENGTNLSIAVGEKTANYDLIVPTSAIREDSDGKFVLIIEEKSSPVGNRYIARKEAVSVITQDETQSAVTGSFDSYTSIITTASKSVEPGDYVRLAS